MSLLFFQNKNVESHELHDLLMTYLKAKQALTNATNQIQELRRKYDAHEKMMWQFEIKEISETVRSTLERRNTYVCDCMLFINHHMTTL